jgi:hypothetical protein
MHRTMRELSRVLESAYYRYRVISRRAWVQANGGVDIIPTPATRLTARSLNGTCLPIVFLPHFRD